MSESLGLLPPDSERMQVSARSVEVFSVPCALTEIPDILYVWWNA